MKGTIAKPRFPAHRCFQISRRVSDVSKFQDCQDCEPHLNFFRCRGLSRVADKCPDRQALPGSTTRAKACRGQIKCRDSDYACQVVQCSNF
jgi:hypothetical protein